MLSKKKLKSFRLTPNLAPATAWIDFFLIHYLSLFFLLSLTLGGDDVQQLYDAYRQSNDEFIEIMRMVGMTKPLHVRRLQKALREWGANPGIFFF